MGVTANFLKLRSTADEVKLNQWHNSFSKVKKLAESKGVPLIAVWTIGDKCGDCMAFEKCLMDSEFKTWMKTSNCYFWFGYSGDKSKDDKFQGTGFMWCYNNGAVTHFPMIRIYWKSGKLDKGFTGSELTGGTSKGAAILVKNLKNILKSYNSKSSEGAKSTPASDTMVAEPYKIRFNEALNAKQINKVLDSIDKNNGYCPCQIKSEDSKCHCKDFLENKGIGGICICKLYVKVKK